LGLSEAIGNFGNSDIPIFGVGMYRKHENRHDVRVVTSFAERVKEETEAFCDVLLFMDSRWRYTTVEKYSSAVTKERGMYQFFKKCYMLKSLFFYCMDVASIVFLFSVNLRCIKIILSELLRHFFS